MSFDTWNFPCSSSACSGAIAGASNTGGSLWATGPGSQYFPSSTLPFIDEMTIIGSILARPGWTSSDNTWQGICSQGQQGKADSDMSLSFVGSGSAPSIRASFWDRGSSAVRHLVDLGDEDGISRMSFGKWYQYGISVSPSGISFCINGSVTPFNSVITNNPGNLDFTGLGDRFFLQHYDADNSKVLSQFVFVTHGWSTLIHGAGAIHNQKLSFSDPATRNRIWDADGNFKNPGENGSLWFGDVYDDVVPQWYLTDGSPRYSKGAKVNEWYSMNGGSFNPYYFPAGLRKQYE